MAAQLDGIVASAVLLGLVHVYRIVKIGDLLGWLPDRLFSSYPLPGSRIPQVVGHFSPPRGGVLRQALLRNEGDRAAQGEKGSIKE